MFDSTHNNVQEYHTKSIKLPLYSHVDTYYSFNLIFLLVLNNDWRLHKFIIDWINTNIRLHDMQLDFIKHNNLHKTYLQDIKET